MVSVARKGEKSPSYKDTNLVQLPHKFEKLTRDMVKAHRAVRLSGRPNFQQCKIPVYSNINISYFEEQLSNYQDKEVVSLLRYGCPISFSGRDIVRRSCRNHKGAVEFGAQVDEYLKREISEGAVLGPFSSSPFETEVVLSPLNTCAKRDSTERRVIVDLSYPKFQPEQSVNGGIDKDSYLGDPIRLRYPSVEDLVHIIWQKGRGCALFKRDLRRAYRQFPVDPGDLHLLAYQWKGAIMIDRVLKSSSSRP